MKNSLLLILLLIISISAYSQIDFGIFVKDKIKRSDMKRFHNMHDKFKKHKSSECIYGDCKTTKSVKKVKILVSKFINSSGSTISYYHYFYVVGSFKNGKLNGKGYIYHYSDKYEHKVDKVLLLKDNVDAILNKGDSKTPNINYIEYVTANFKDNIVNEGTYSLNYSVEKYAKPFSHISFFDVSEYSSYVMPFVRDFSRYEINLNKKRENIRYFYSGKFKTSNFLDYGRENNLFSKILIKYITDEDLFIQYKITPIADSEKFDLEYLISNENQLNTKEIFFEDYNCIGCDITEDSEFAGRIKSSVLAEKKREIAIKVNRAKSFVGRFIQGAYLAYVSGYNSKNGCVSAVRFPYKVRKKGEYPQKFLDACSHENYKIIPNAHVCPNCDGWGTKSAEIIYNTTHTAVDVTGKKVGDDYKTVTESGKYKDVTCPVCSGRGVIYNQK